MLKRIGFINIIALLLMVVFCGTALASTEPSTQDKILIEKAEIIDSEILFNRAINNVSDVKIRPEANAQLKKAGSSTKLDLEVYSTTQLLKKVEKADGKVVLNFATTSFATYPADEWDIAGGLKAYSTIYYEVVRDNNNIKYYDLYKVTGGWDKYDNTYQLSGREVRIAALGGGLGGGFTHDQWFYKYPSSNSYTYYAPSSWIPASPTSHMAVGSTSCIEIDRFGETWDLTLNNNLPALM